jgi:hypothetical protein
MTEVAKKTNKLRYVWSNLVTRGEPKQHENSTFYGYVDADLLIAVGDVEVCNITVYGMTVADVNGRFRLDLPDRKHTDEDSGEVKYIPHVRPNSAATRKRMTSAMRTAFVAHRNEQRIMRDALTA